MMYSVVSKAWVKSTLQVFCLQHAPGGADAINGSGVLENGKAYMGSRNLNMKLRPCVVCGVVSHGFAYHVEK